MKKSESTEDPFLSGRQFTAAETRDIREMIESCGLALRNEASSFHESDFWDRLTVTSTASRFYMSLRQLI